MASALFMMIPHGARRAFHRINEQRMNENHQADNSKAQDSNSETSEYTPSTWDVLHVRALLQWRMGVPVEIVDEIIDTAEYWLSTTASMTPPEKGTHRIIRKDHDQVLLKTVPLCYDRKQLERSPDSPRPLPHRSSNHPCRKIVFRLSSHDQGSGRIHPNMYEHSWTWFDAEIIRGAHAQKMYIDGEERILLPNEKGETAISRESGDPLLLPGADKIQLNGARVSDTQDVEIVWHYQDDIQADSPAASDIEKAKGRGRATLDGRFVREMQVGDSIAVWARARFPGWSNHVYRASVTVYWAV